MENRGFREAAIPLVTVDPESKKLTLNIEALKMIESISSPLSIVGVAGMYRTGKSYLMNRVILNRSSGFGVAPTINACTKGIWVWAKPLKGESEDGKITNVLVVDSEGLGAVDQDSTHDCRIFAIVLLISSLFIYNSVGTIDENAINSLSLVINLTKHIHLKSQSSEELDSEDYAQYFPSFLWVLRDFTLQLVDEEGDAITPRGYLEGALTQQKGFTDEVEQKNRIRRLIQTFFKDRDCFTMVRPLTDEEQLQNLDRKELRELRSEFIEQVTDLRKRIFKQSKIKFMNGKAVTGEMLAGLLKNYVSAINDGAVPNIENAWSYICKSQCQKLFDSCFRLYDDRVSEKLNPIFPTSAENIEAIHANSKHEALEKFKKEAMGEQVDLYIQDLKNKIKDRYITIVSENKSEFEKLLSDSLRQYYAKIDARVKNSEYRNYYEYERELQTMRTYFMDLEPQGPNKLGIINEFLFSKCNDVAHFLIKYSQNELENELSILREAKDKLENDYYGAQESLNKEKNALSLKVFELETRKSDLETRNQMLLQKIDSMKGEKNSVEDELGKKLDNEKKRFRDEIMQLKQKLQAEEDLRRENEKKLILARSDYEKETALLRQGIEFHEKSGEQWNRKESSYKEEIKELKEKLTLDSKDLKKKYEDQISKLQAELFTARDTLAEYQSEIDKKAELHVSTCKDFEDKNKTFQSALEEKEAAIREYEFKIASYITGPRDAEDTISELREKYEEAVKKLEDALAKIKEKDEKIKVMTGQHKKEKALLEQNLNFHEIQVSDLKRQLEENKRLNENALSALEGRGEKRTGMSKDMEELKAAFEAKMDQMVQDHEKSRQFLNQKIEQLSEANDDLVKEKSKVVEKYERALKELQLKCDTLTDDNRRVNDAMKNLESIKAKEISDLKEMYKSKIEGLETEIDNLKYKNNTEINIFQTKSEDNMRQLRHFFESEKARLEKRLNEDREKYDKTFQNMKEEYENRIKHMNEVFEEQTENMQQEIKELEIQNIANSQRFDQEVTSKNQRIELMEKSLQETKDSLEKIQESTSVNLKQALGSFEEERKALTKKIEAQAQEMNMRDLQLFQLKQELEQASSNKDKKISELETLSADKEKDNSKLRESLENLTSRLQALADENMDKENKMGKELALSNQKNEFYMKRINELNNQLEAQSKNIEERLANQREEIAQEMKESLTRVKGERDLMEQRYEAKKRQIKELESEYTNRISEQEKTIAVLQEKLNNVENKRFELEKRISTEANNVQEQLRKQKENFALEKKALQSELEALRVKVYEMELELVEVQANYDKDLALWQGKNQFVESQRDQYKLELNELQKNFEILVQRFNQSRITEKEEAENSQSALLTKIEQRYQLQLQELKDQLKMSMAEAEDKIKKLERENKKLAIQLSDAEKVQDDQLERRLRESMNNERKITEELLTARKEHENKIADIQKRLEEEKEKSKNKIQKLEQMYKESENKRNMMIFEHEKEKAKWNVENGQLMSQQHDYLEQIDILAQKKDAMVRENERLTVELKQLKRAATTGVTSSIHGFVSGGFASKRSDMIYSGIDRSYSKNDEGKKSSGLANMKYSDTNFLDQ